MKDERQLGTFAKRAALLLLPFCLAACADGEQRSFNLVDDSGNANQPYPANYRGESVAFLKTYLNNPVAVRDASVSEPIERTVGGPLRFVSCVKYNARESDGSYRGARERGIVYVNGRLDHIIENAGDICAGATYAPFPELQTMTR